MKRFARWLFLRTHRNELLTVARFIRGNATQRRALLDTADKDLKGMCKVAELLGRDEAALFVLDALDLFYD